MPLIYKAAIKFLLKTIKIYEYTANFAVERGHPVQSNYPSVPELARLGGHIRIYQWRPCVYVPEGVYLQRAQNQAYGRYLNQGDTLHFLRSPKAAAEEWSN